MITSFDDYCVHQTAESVAEPSQSDRNFYDRYWFNGFDRDGGFVFEAALGLYPNRRVMDAHMFGIGYQHPEWGHACWKGELATGAEHFDHDELDPAEYKNIHTHHIVRARLGDQVGVGTLETVAIGRHSPSGLRSFFDGAP